MKKWMLKILKRGLIAIVSAILLFFVLDWIFPVDTHIDYSPVVESRDGTILHAYLTKDEQWRMATNLNELTPELKKAILFKEDKYFYYHFGVNPFAVGRALINNIFSLKRTSGASTITMQVVRMLDPKPRTYLNKIIEMFRATQLELHYSKDRILQMYLTLVPYGSNIQGVKAASLFYFNKSPDQLSLAEITALSIIPNRPNSLVMGKDNEKIVKARNVWLQRFQKAHLFKKSIIDDALQEPLIAYRHNAPAAIPQLARRLRRMYPNLPIIHTSVEKNMQVKAEGIVKNYMDGLRLQKIYNAAILIIDNNTHQVLTYIGSPDFHDQLHGGQVDGVIAPRSPGSTLKPLLYGLCFDRGIVTPKRIIADVPVNFKGYAPENYDLAFRGNVTIEDALRKSLNVPAVKLLNRIGVGTFASKLTQTGFTSIWKHRKEFGLSVILGGCDVKLEELTNMYSMLANDGYYYPVKWLQRDTLLSDSAQLKGLPILSPPADFMVTKILSELHRPDLPNIYDQAKGIPKIAWKTGTSYGRKDAWSVGFNKRYTIGVWVGNFSGRGSPVLYGAGTAVPLLFQLFNAIDKHASDEWITAPKGLGFRLVCQNTGMVPGDFCTQEVMDYYIPGISSNKHCDYMKKVWVSADGKYSYCTTCLPFNGYKTELFPNISPELAAYYDAHNIPYKKIPPHNPACTRTFEGQAPVITSLTNGLTYIVIKKEHQKLQLSCTAANDVSKVYWYVNDRYLTSTGIGEKTFFYPASHDVKISCTDDKGWNANINIKVKFI